MDTNNELDFNTTKEPNGRYKLRSSLKKRKSRNPLEILDISEDTVTIPIPPRRVSFAASNYVKPFVDDPEKNTIWDATYEEEVNHTDSTKSESTNASEVKSQFQDVDTLIESHTEVQKLPNEVISNIYCDQSVVDMEFTCGNATSLKGSNSSEENISKNATALSKETLLDMEFTCKWDNNIILSADMPQQNVTLSRDHLVKNSTIYQVADMSMTLCDVNEKAKGKTNIFQSDLANQSRSILSDKENIFFSKPHDNDMEFTCLVQNKILEMTKSQQRLDNNPLQVISLGNKNIVPDSADNEDITKNENAYMPHQSEMEFSCFDEDQPSDTGNQKDFEKSFVLPTVNLENKENEFNPKFLKCSQTSQIRKEIVQSPDKSGMEFTCNFQNKILINDQHTKYDRNSILHATVNEPADMEAGNQKDFEKSFVLPTVNLENKENEFNPKFFKCSQTSQIRKEIVLSPDQSGMEFTCNFQNKIVVNDQHMKNDRNSILHATVNEPADMEFTCKYDFQQQIMSNQHSFLSKAELTVNPRIEISNTSVQENKAISVSPDIGNMNQKLFGKHPSDSDNLTKPPIDKSDTTTQDNQPIIASQNIEKMNQNSSGKELCSSNKLDNSLTEINNMQTRDNQVITTTDNIEKIIGNSRIENQPIVVPQKIENIKQNSFSKELCGSNNLVTYETELNNTESQDSQAMSAPSKIEKTNLNSLIKKPSVSNHIINSRIEINDTTSQDSQPIIASEHCKKINQNSRSKENSGSNKLDKSLAEMNNKTRDNQGIIATHIIGNIKENSRIEMNTTITQENRMIGAPQRAEKTTYNLRSKDLVSFNDPVNSRLELNNTTTQGGQAITAPSNIEKINLNSLSKPFCGSNDLVNSRTEIIDVTTQDNEPVTASEYIHKMNQNSHKELCGSINLDNSLTEINNTETHHSQAVIPIHNIGKINENSLIGMNNTITQENQLITAPQMAEKIKHNSLRKELCAFNDLNNSRTELIKTTTQGGQALTAPHNIGKIKQNSPSKKPCGPNETNTIPLMNSTESEPSEKLKGKKNVHRLPFLEKKLDSIPGNVMCDKQISKAENDIKKSFLHERSTYENIIDSCLVGGNKTLVDEECSLIGSIPSLDEEDLKYSENENQMEVSENKEEHPSTSQKDRSPLDKVPVNKVIYSEPMKIAIYDEFPSMQTSGLINPFNVSSMHSMEDTLQLIQATFSKPQLQKTGIFDDEKSQSGTFSKPQLQKTGIFDDEKSQSATFSKQQLPITDLLDDEKSQSATFLKPQCPKTAIFEDEKSQSEFMIKTDILQRNEENKWNETNTMEAVLTNIQNEVTHIQFQDINYEKLKKTIEERRQICNKLETFLPNFRFPEIPSVDLEQKRKSQSLPNMSFDVNSCESSLDELESGEDTNCNKSMLLEPSKSFHEKIISVCKRSKSSLSLKHFEENTLYIFSTLHGCFMVFVETHPEDGRVIEVKSASTLYDSAEITVRFLHKCFQEKLKKSTLESYLGSYYDVLSLLDHICLMVDEVMDSYYEFLLLQDLYQSMKFHEDFSISFEILHTFSPIWWTIKLKLSSFTKIDSDSLQLDSKWGNINEEHIKQILRNIDEGVGSSLRNFISKVVDYFGRTQLKYKLQ